MLGVALTALFLWMWPRNTVSSGSESHPGSTADNMSGEALARIYCAMCHLFPDPSLLKRETWYEQVLPEMQARLGLYPGALDDHPEAKYLKASGLFPSAPLLSLEHWNRIEAFYLSNSPVLQPTGKVENIELQLRGFTPEIPSIRDGPPAASLTFIDEKHREILVGDMNRLALKVFDSTNELRQIIPVDNIPVSVWPVESGIYLTCIGSLGPSQIPQGILCFVPREGDRYGSPRVLLSKLPRPVHSAFGDLNGNGRDDIVISMFGHVNIGRLSWFENLGAENYKEHVLVHRDGTIHTALKDMNGNGFLDIVVLTAQAVESMEIFYNNGKGEFTQQVLFQKPPSWGHTHFELVDMNGDGMADLVVSNGDNGEWSDSPTKAYHGIRIYLNRGDNKFEEAYFFRMNGVYQFVIDDFDQDGDADIAAVSFYPDWRHSAKESFVYLRNDEKLTFKAFTFPEFLAGRWMTIGAGDLDGDGDKDLVLGSYYNGPGSVPSVLFNDWKTNEPSFIVLRNGLR